MTKELLNKKELSNYLGFSVGKIDNLIKHNKIGYYKIGKNVRFNVKMAQKRRFAHRQGGRNRPDRQGPRRRALLRTETRLIL